MHLVSLNIWGGYLENQLLNFVRSSQEIDIFCFQEVFRFYNYSSYQNINKINFQIYEKLVKEFMDTINLPKILCGDFNLIPDKESIQILEKGMNNLIRLHRINSTRTNLYTKEEKFSDYIFTSYDIKTLSFEIYNEIVSDHAPLSLIFSIT